MVKINAKILSILSLLFIFAMIFAGVAHASAPRLKFSDVDVKVGTKSSSNLLDGQTVDDDAEPGDNIEVKVQVQNNFTSAEDLEIQDVSVKVTIEGIDNGDDAEEESSSFDLRAGATKRVTLKFNVPYEVDEDTFNIIIEATGDDENGTSQDNQMNLKLDVDKDTHNIIFTRATLVPAQVTCGSKRSVQLVTGIINIGSDDEDDVSLLVQSEELGIDAKTDIGTLSSDPEDTDDQFSKTFSFKLPDSVEPGVYPIDLKVLYNNNRKQTTKSVELTVNECALKTSTSAQTTPTQTQGNSAVEILVPQGSQAARTSSSTVSDEETVPSDTVVTQESFARSNVFVLSMIAGIAVVVVGIVLLIVFLVRG